MFRRGLESGVRGARKLVVAVIGATVVLIGVAMVVLPGPAVLVIPAGLGILGLEFAWARRLQQDAHARARQGWSRLLGQVGGAASAPGS